MFTPTEFKRNQPQRIGQMNGILSQHRLSAGTLRSLLGWLGCLSGTMLWIATGQVTRGQDLPTNPPALAAQRTSVPADVLARLEMHHDLTYARYGDRSLQLDLFRPRNRQRPLPTIVCIHGGGWFQGTRQSQHALAQRLADHGYVTVAITYRLSGEAGFPAAIQDCKAAVRWLRANASQYGVDPESIGATGLSAGGHLAALLATSGDVTAFEGDGGNADQSSRIQACYAMGAQSDFNAEPIQRVRRDMKVAEGKPNIWVQFLGAAPDEDPEVYQLASPLHHLDAGDPPLAFMAGEHDNEGTRANVTRDKLAELGIATELLIIADAPHAFLGRQAWFDQAVERSLAFFDAHLK